MTIINRAKFHHFPAKDTKVIDWGRYPHPQADSVLKRPGEIGLNYWVKDHEEVHLERAALLRNFHQFLLVLVGLWKTSL